MKIQPFPRSSVAKIVADLGIDDPDSVFRIVIEPGHVTVHGYERDQFDAFGTKGPQPAQWARVFPIDFEA